MKFEDMDIEKSVSESLKHMGFESPTEIQVETIPLIKQGYDVIGQSYTGSGKTAAFGIPLVEKVAKCGKVQALILEPTRELAIQVANELAKFSHFKKLSIQTVYGGVSIGQQIYGIKKADIVVGTPGRILDHLERGTLSTSGVKIFVLDEADRMIDMGFIDDIKRIERQIPRGRQTLLFSATMPENLKGIRDSFTRNAKKVKTRIKVKEDVLKQYYCDVDRQRKFSLLVHMINQEKPELSIIFCNSRRDADVIAKNLNFNSVDAKAIHGGLTQDRREDIIRNFHNGTIRILVATDVAARGLDIKNVTHIFNYSIPKNSEDYTNRIGRTARAGESGKAISLLSREDHNSFKRVIRDFDHNIERMEVGNFKILPFKRQEYHDRRNFGDRSFHRRRHFS
jgi:ATP-dependent RNA helicase DeaD